MDICEWCKKSIFDGDRRRYHDDCWEQVKKELFGNQRQITPDMTERFIKHFAYLSSEGNPSKESNTMVIEFITIDGQRYRLTPVGAEEAPAETGIASLRGEKFNVDLSGKVIKDWKLNIFTRKNDGSEGRVHSLLVGDETGTIKVALWDSHTETVKDIKVGDVIVIANGYTKKGLVKDGKQYIELHAGTKSVVSVAPKVE